MGDNIPHEKNHEKVNEKNHEKVTSVGDSWILARSKSYPDRVYYFNTLTGKSLWNLSSTELAKAEKVTNRSNQTNDEYPEPKEPPAEPPSRERNLKKTKIPPKDLKMQVVNNNYGAPAFPYPPPPLGQPYPALAPYLAPGYSSSQPVNTNIPPKPYFMPPPATPLVDERVLVVHRTSIPMSNRFKMGNPASVPIEEKEQMDAYKENNTKKFFNKIKNEVDLKQNINMNFNRCKKITFKVDRSKYISMNRNLKKLGIKDLRELLVAKRGITNNISTKSTMCTSIIQEKEEEELGEGEIKPEEDNHKHGLEQQVLYLNVMDASTSSDTTKPQEEPESMLVQEVAASKVPDQTIDTIDDEDNDENLPEDVSLDMQRLKTHLGCTEDDIWFIMPDTNVFISNLRILNMLVSSDPLCRILISSRVYKELMMTARTVAGDSSETKARQACRFLTELQDDDRALTDIELTRRMATDVDLLSGDDQILDCCLRLVEDSFLLVFLSNDRLLQRKSLSSQVSTLTVKEIKSFLTSYQQIEDPTKMEKPITITIKNSGANSQIESDTNETAPEVAKVTSKPATRILYVATEPSFIRKISNKTQISSTFERTSPVEASTGTDAALIESPRAAKFLRRKSLQISDSMPLKQHDTKKISTETQVSPPREKTCKNMSDASAQTDLPMQIAYLRRRTKSLVDENIQTGLEYPTELNSSENTFKSATEQNLQKKREIRLNRNSSCASDGQQCGQSTAKKISWWRRRKNQTNEAPKPVHHNRTEAPSPPLITQPKNFKSKLQATTKDQLRPPIPNKSPAKPDAKANTSHNSVDDSDKESIAPKKISFNNTYTRNESFLSQKTIEESSFSSSDVISNTRSSVYSDNSLNLKNDRNRYKATYDYKVVRPEEEEIVLFQITDSSMEENLKTGADEWISRFEQIMDEVLTQVLQRDLLAVKMPPPWTLHEAAICMAFKYDTNHRIKTMSHKLATVILDVMDSRGNINRDMKPQKFMEMFSYGVYLVDAVQVVEPDLEDIQIAMDSLTKLLGDIKDHNSESMDTWVDTSADVECFNDTATEECNADMMSDVGPERRELSPERRNNHPLPATSPEEPPKGSEGLLPNNQNVKFLRNLNVNPQLLKQSFTLQNTNNKEQEFNKMAKQPEAGHEKKSSSKETLSNNQSAKFLRNLNVDPQLLKQSFTLQNTNDKEKEFNKMLKQPEAGHETISSSKETLSNNQSAKFLRNLNVDPQLLKQSFTLQNTNDKEKEFNKMLKQPEAGHETISSSKETLSNNQSAKFLRNLNVDPQLLKQSFTLQNTNDKEKEFNKMLKQPEAGHETISSSKETLSNNQSAKFLRNLNVDPQLLKQSFTLQNTNDKEKEFNKMLKQPEAGHETISSSKETLSNNQSAKFLRNLNVDPQLLKQSFTLQNTNNKEQEFNKMAKQPEAGHETISSSKETLSNNQSAKFLRNLNVDPEFLKKSITLKNTKDRDKESNKLEQPETRNEKPLSPKTPPKEESPKASGPKIIMKFTKCDEFEKKLKNKAKAPLDMDMLDYSEDEMEYDCEADPYYEGEEAHSGAGEGDYIELNEYFDEGEYVEDDEDGYEEDGLLEKETEDDQVLDENGDVKPFIQRFLKEIKETLIEVRGFCLQIHTELSAENEVNSNRKSEIKEQTENAKLMINNLLKTLEGILEREANGNEKSIEALLPSSSLQNYGMTDSQHFTYREVIEKCASQARTLLDALDLITNDVLESI